MDSTRYELRRQAIVENCAPTPGVPATVEVPLGRVKSVLLRDDQSVVQGRGTDPVAEKYARERIAHWDKVAETMGLKRGASKHYYHLLAQIYKFLIPPGQRVLEVGCGTGDLLAAVKPSFGVGIDFSNVMIHYAKERHPELRFAQVDAHELSKDGEMFDAIILSDLLNDVWDVQRLLEQVAAVSHPGTRVIINIYSRLWELPLSGAVRLGLAKPKLRQNWLTVDDVANLLNLAGFELIRSWQEIMFPARIPIISQLFNRFVVKLWPFKHLALTNFIVARPKPHSGQTSSDSRVSVIIPARNEAGNIREIFERTPEMNGGTELIFVEGHSKDDTFATIEHAMREFPHRDTKLLRQTGVGKGDAVRLGFANASGAILMILDADLTVPPEDLPRFSEAIRSGNAEFVNGVRLVYPMEAQAMRFFNFLGNKFFSLAFSWLLGQNIKDTLCGTKVIRRSDYEKIAANRSYFGDFDPFGDFDLIFGAAKLNLKILDMPIRYRERTYGTTNIQRWRHGVLLLRMVLFAASKIKFI